MAIGISYEQVRRMIRLAEPTARPKGWIINGIVDNWDIAIDHGIAENERRLSHFLSQISVETGHWRTLVEYGTDAYFRRYDGRSDLGNTQPGDGPKFRGRYYIQLTGRNNYEHYGGNTGIACHTTPARFAKPRHVREALALSVAYWHAPTSKKGAGKSINRFADGDDPNDVKNVTRCVNGGLNGYDERLKYYRAAREVWPDGSEHLRDRPTPPDRRPTEPPTEPAPEIPSEIAQLFADTNADRIRRQHDERTVLIFENPGLDSGPRKAPPETPDVNIADLKEWPDKRKLVALGQLHLRRSGRDVGAIDGLIGPQTLHALDEWEQLQWKGGPPDNWRDKLPPPDSPAPPQANVWPRQKDLADFYGKKGQNQVMLKTPYPMRLAWDLHQTITRFSCHEKVHDSAKRVLEAALAHYGLDKIRELRLDRFSGCLNVRRMRGGSSWSTHSWGIAIDFDSANNKLKWGRDRATLAGPEYEKWWELWEAEGWVSLGRTRNFDWMHVQAARL